MAVSSFCSSNVFIRCWTCWVPANIQSSGKHCALQKTTFVPACNPICFFPLYQMFSVHSKSCYWHSPCTNTTCHGIFLVCPVIALIYAVGWPMLLLPLHPESFWNWLHQWISAALKALEAEGLPAILGCLGAAWNSHSFTPGHDCFTNVL